MAESIDVTKAAVRDRGHRLSSNGTDSNRGQSRIEKMPVELAGNSSRALSIASRHC